jgi:hypothetical protein
VLLPSLLVTDHDSASMCKLFPNQDGPDLPPPPKTFATVLNNIFVFFM